MTERDDAVPRKRSQGMKGRKQTPAQAAAARENLRRGQERKRAMAEQAKAEGREPMAERWAKLLDGRITVRDLDDEEVARMKVRGKDGTFSGKERMVPSHLAQQFHAEAIKRANGKFRTALQDAVKTLADIANNPDAKESDRIKAANIIVERVLGKAVETVRHEGASPWDALMGAVVDVDRDLDREASEFLGNDGGA